MRKYSLEQAGPPPGLRPAPGAVATCGTCTSFEGGSGMCHKYNYPTQATNTCDDYDAKSSMGKFKINIPEFQDPGGLGGGDLFKTSELVKLAAGMPAKTWGSFFTPFHRRYWGQHRKQLYNEYKAREEAALRASQEAVKRHNDPIYKRINEIEADLRRNWGNGREVRDAHRREVYELNRQLKSMNDYSVVVPKNTQRQIFMEHLYDLNDLISRNPIKSFLGAVSAGGITSTAGAADAEGFTPSVVFRGLWDSIWKGREAAVNEVKEKKDASPGWVDRAEEKAKIEAKARLDAAKAEEDARQASTEKQLREEADARSSRYEDFQKTIRNLMEGNDSATGSDQRNRETPEEVERTLKEIRERNTPEERKEIEKVIAQIEAEKIEQESAKGLEGLRKARVEEIEAEIAERNKPKPAVFPSPTKLDPPPPVVPPTKLDPLPPVVPPVVETNKKNIPSVTAPANSPWYRNPWYTVPMLGAGLLAGGYGLHALTRPDPPKKKKKPLEDADMQKTSSLALSTSKASNPVKPLKGVAYTPNYISSGHNPVNTPQSAIAQLNSLPVTSRKGPVPKTTGFSRVLKTPGLLKAAAGVAPSPLPRSVIPPPLPTATKPGGAWYNPFSSHWFGNRKRLEQRHREKQEAAEINARNAHQAEVERINKHNADVLDKRRSIDGRLVSGHEAHTKAIEALPPLEMAKNYAPPLLPGPSDAARRWATIKDSVPLAVGVPGIFATAGLGYGGTRKLTGLFNGSPRDSNPAEVKTKYYSDPPSPGGADKDPDKPATTAPPPTADATRRTEGKPEADKGPNITADDWVAYEEWKKEQEGTNQLPPLGPGGGSGGGSGGGTGGGSGGTKPDATKPDSPWYYNPWYTVPLAGGVLAGGYGLHAMGEAERKRKKREEEEEKYASYRPRLLRRALPTPKPALMKIAMMGQTTFNMGSGGMGMSANFDANFPATSSPVTSPMSTLGAPQEINCSDPQFASHPKCANTKQAFSRPKLLKRANRFANFFRMMNPFASRVPAKPVRADPTPVATPSAMPPIPQDRRLVKDTPDFSWANPTPAQAAKPKYEVRLKIPRGIPDHAGRLMANRQSMEQLRAQGLVGDKLHALAGRAIQQWQPKPPLSKPAIDPVRVKIDRQSSVPRSSQVQEQARQQLLSRGLNADRANQLAWKAVEKWQNRKSPEGAGAVRAIPKPTPATAPKRVLKPGEDSMADIRLPAPKPAPKPTPVANSMPEVIRLPRPAPQTPVAQQPMLSASPKTQAPMPQAARDAARKKKKPTPGMPVKTSSYLPKLMKRAKGSMQKRAGIWKLPISPLQTFFRWKKPSFTTAADQAKAIEAAKQSVIAGQSNQDVRNFLTLSPAEQQAALAAGKAPILGGKTTKAPIHEYQTGAQAVSNAVKPLQDELASFRRAQAGDRVWQAGIGGGIGYGGYRMFGRGKEEPEKTPTFVKSLRPDLKGPPKPVESQEVAGLQAKIEELLKGSKDSSTEIAALKKQLEALKTAPPSSTTNTAPPPKDEKPDVKPKPSGWNPGLMAALGVGALGTGAAAYGYYKNQQEDKKRKKEESPEPE